MRKSIDYSELCRYDNAFKYVADIVVYSDEFMLGNKGERLRLIVSEYGFNRLMRDSLDGLIDIEPSSMRIEAFDYPEITDEQICEELDRRRALLIDVFKAGKPLPEELRRWIDEDNAV